MPDAGESSPIRHDVPSNDVDAPPLAAESPGLTNNESPPDDHELAQRMIERLNADLAAATQTNSESSREIEQLRSSIADLEAQNLSALASLADHRRWAADLGGAILLRDRRIAQYRATRRWRFGERMQPILHPLKVVARTLRAWSKAVAGQAPSAQRQPLSSVGSAAAPAPDPSPQPPLRQAPLLPPATRYDVICLAIIDWDFRFQRPQQIAGEFARQGHRVFWVSPTRFLASTAGAAYSLESLAPSIWETHTRAPTTPNVYEDRLGGEQRRAIVSSLAALRSDAQIKNAVCLVQIPFWTPVAEELRRLYGWRIIYDCMDEWDTFPGIGKAINDMERELAPMADVVSVTAQKLYDKWQGVSRRCLLVRNGTDFDHFQKAWPGQVLEHIAHPVIGYFGAIADWFDVPLVEYAARARPDWQFVLVGGVYSTDVDALQQLPNVRLLGHQSYGVIPAYLRQFDACIIPFKINRITEATDPVKFYEYVSLGKPVVSVALPELAGYRDYLYIATDQNDFVSKLAAALAESDPLLVERRIALARTNTWTDRYHRLHAAIASAHAMVTIIVVTYNNRSLSEQCLRSIFERTAYPAYEIIVVDNASCDDTPEMLARVASEHDNMRVILNQQNMGFARANNQAVHESYGDTIVFLNNDTVVATGWLDGLVRHLDDPQLGLVGAVTNHAGNEAQIRAGYKDLAQLEAFAAAYTWGHDGEVFDIRVAPLFCAAIRRADLDAVGGLDERYGIGMFEDDDLAEKVRRQLHLRVVCAEDVYVHHVGQASFALLSSAEYNRLFELPFHSIR